MTAIVLGVCACFITGCSSSEPAVKEGDAEIVKETQANENPAAKNAREQMQQSGGATAGKAEPPPGN